MRRRTENWNELARKAIAGQTKERSSLALRSIYSIHDDMTDDKPRASTPHTDDGDMAAASVRASEKERGKKVRNLLFVKKNSAEYNNNESVRSTTSRLWEHFSLLLASASFFFRFAASYSLYCCCCWLDSIRRSHTQRSTIRVALVVHLKLTWTLIFNVSVSSSHLISLLYLSHVKCGEKWQKGKQERDEAAAGWNLRQ